MIAFGALATACASLLGVDDVDYADAADRDAAPAKNAMVEGDKDASVTSDAGASAAPASNATADAGTNWCAKNVPNGSFCEDFDQPAFDDVEVRWTSYVDPANQLDHDDSVDAPSGPFALVSKLYTPGVPSYLSKALNRTVTTAHVSFYVRLQDDLDDGTVGTLAALVFAGENGTTTFQLQVSDHKVSIAVVGGVEFQSDTALAPIRRLVAWTLVTLDVSLTSSHYTLTLDHDTPAVDTTFNAPDALANPELRLGVVAATGDVDARYDDVIFSAE